MPQPIPYDPAIHHRQSIRLHGYDYTGPGQYFVTMCTEDRRPLFGTVVKGRMVLNEAGLAAAECWRAIPTHFPNAMLDEWVIMPDHVHGIIEIGVGAKNLSPTVRAKNLSPHPQTVPAKNLSLTERAKNLSPQHGTSRTLGSMVRGFKIGVTKALGFPVWQRNYYEIIIWDEPALYNIRQYIQNNPANFDAVMNCGEPRYLGNRALLDGSKVGFLASRGETKRHGVLPLKKGQAVISGFLSPMEREVFKAGLTHGKPLIWVKPWGLEDGTDTPAIRRALTEHRLLILSPFDNAIDAPSARRAAWCNEYVMHHCDKLVLGYLKPGGMLDCLLSDAPLGLEYWTDGMPTQAKPHDP